MIETIQWKDYKIKEEQLDKELAQRTYPMMRKIIEEHSPIVNNEKKIFIILTNMRHELDIGQCHRTYRIFSDLNDFTVKSLFNIYSSTAWEYSKIHGDLPVGRLCNHYIIFAESMDVVCAF